MQISSQPLEQHDVPANRIRRPSPILGWLAIGAIVGGSLFYGLAATKFEIAEQFDADWETHISPILQRHTMEVIVTLWFAFLGGCFGSFLNVVIYRLPAGRTLFGNSGCPRCGHAIRPQHNIPVIGWLFLQGKCRDCRLPIAVRYPLVELLVAGLFLGITYGEILPGGSNLPNFTAATFPGVVGVVLDPQWELLSIAILHAAVLTILMSWAYICYDKHAIPFTYAATVLIAIGAATFFFPHLVPTRNGSLAELPETLAWGLAVGWLSWYAGAVRGRREPRVSLASVIAGYLLLAITFGGIATLSIFLLEGMVRTAVFWVDRRGIVPWGLPLCLVGLLQVLLWQWLAQGPWWPHLGSLSSLVAGTAVAVTLNIAFVSRAEW
jgi:leader peptidase (prepilin peptidase)/N-methyltransferase